MNFSTAHKKCPPPKYGAHVSDFKVTPTLVEQNTTINGQFTSNIPPPLPPKYRKKEKKVNIGKYICFFNSVSKKTKNLINDPKNYEIIECIGMLFLLGFVYIVLIVSIILVL